MRNPRESDTLRQVLELLALRRIWHFRLNGGAMQIKTPNGGVRYVRFTSTEGLPDVIAVRGGRFVGIETKSPVGKLSREQRETRDSLLAAGAEYLVIRDPRELDGWLCGSVRSEDLRN